MGVVIKFPTRLRKPVKQTVSKSVATDTPFTSIDNPEGYQVGDQVSFAGCRGTITQQIMDSGELYPFGVTFSDPESVTWFTSTGFCPDDANYSDIQLKVLRRKAAK